MIAIELAMAAAATVLQAAPTATVHAPVPLRSPGAWVWDSDYPSEAIRDREQGIVAFTLDVDAAGMPTGCLVEGSVSPALDSATCRILRLRARFRPARDAEGRSVAGRYAGRFRWILPVTTDFGRTLGSVGSVTRVRADAGGTLRCAVSDTSDPPGRDQDESCAFLEDSGLPNVVRRLGHEGELTSIFQVIPEGAPGPRVPPGDPGDLIIESLARVSVGADGATGECRLTTRRVIARVRGLGTPPDLCSLFTAGVRFPYRFRGAAGAYVAWVMSVVYLRDGPPPP